MGYRRLRLLITVMALTLGFSGTSCIFGTDEGPPPEIQPPAIPQPTSPQNIVDALEVIYNDKIRTAIERRDEYEKLLAKQHLPECPQDSCEAFLFDFQEADEQQGAPPSWGGDEEVAAHENLFRAQENGEIQSLELQIQNLPAEDLNELGRPGWRLIQVTDVHLRLMFNPNDGLEVTQGQADFKFYPYGGRWWLAEWIDRPPLQ